METPAAEKKDKMEGTVFSDLGKKPSETRGKSTAVPARDSDATSVSEALRAKGSQQRP